MENTLRTDTDTIAYTAWWYAKVLGWPVFPLHTPTAGGCSCGKPDCRSIGKHPRTPNGFKDASADPHQALTWWGQWPDANIGLDCGAAGLVVLDFDTAKPDFAGGDLLAMLLDKYPTTTARTGSGGYHLLYRQPEGLHLGGSPGRLPKRVDIKAEGGYIVLFPSEHETGNRYSWLPGCAPTQKEPQPLPAEVLDLLRPTEQTKAQERDRDGGGLDDVATAAACLQRLAVWRVDDYGTDGAWVGVGMALSELGDVGLRLWEEWSRRSPKYTPGECAAKWRSFEPGKGITLASLIYWAKQDDPTGHRERIHTNGTNGTGPAVYQADNADGADDTSNAKEDAPQAQEGKGGDAARKPTQAEILYSLASTYTETIFTAQDGTPYAFVPVQGRRECYRLTDSNFAGWLTALYRSMCHGAMPGAEGRKEAIAALAYDARTTRRDVFVRVGGHRGKVYIDLGTEEWDAIEVDEAGWRIVERPPVAFRRPASLRPLPKPLVGRDMAHLRRFLNLEPEQWPLVAAWLIAAASPTGPYPALGFVGEQGSAKSTNVRVLKETLDPAAAGLRGQPEDIRDLWVGANNSWMLAYDNVSHLNNDVSDALCRLATGGGYAKRANYTDDGEFLMDAQRPVVINGIGDVVTRPDLMDRTILITPPVIPEDKRRNEKEFWRDFEQARPFLLGALLDGLSVALARIGNVQLETLPRMADFALLAVAAEPAYRADVGFLEAYAENREEAHATVIESSTLGEHLRKLVLVNGAWEGTASELLAALNERASESEQRGRAWPKAPNKLPGALQRIAPSLRHIGVDVALLPRQKDGRRLRLTRLNG